MKRRLFDLAQFAIVVLFIGCTSASVMHQNGEAPAAHVDVPSDTALCSFPFGIRAGTYYFASETGDEIGILQACDEPYPPTFTISCVNDSLMLPYGAKDDPTADLLAYSLADISTSADSICYLARSNQQEFEFSWLDQSKGLLIMLDYREHAEHPSNLLVHESSIQRYAIRKQSCIECEGINCAHLVPEEKAQLEKMKKVSGLWKPRHHTADDLPSFLASPLELSDVIEIKSNDNFATGTVQYLSRAGSDEYEPLSYNFKNGFMQIEFAYYETIFRYALLTANDTALTLVDRDTVEFARVSH